MTGVLIEIPWLSSMIGIMTDWPWLKHVIEMPWIILALIVWGLVVGIAAWILVRIFTGPPPRD